MRCRWIYLWLLLVLCGCSHHATVVWISIDGFRSDYLNRYHPPTLERLAHEGAFTTQEVPIFPSLTFPNHAAQATGRNVDGHGIPMNDFYDSASKKLFSFPDPDSVLRAEPIWTTAKRQGLRVAVLDWPMSHAQQGNYKSDYFFDRYDTQTDEERLTKVAAILKADQTHPPLQLIMTYLAHVDSVGHRSGPDSPEVGRAVQEADASITRFLQSVEAWFELTHAPADSLYLLITTDHGMQSVHTLTNMDLILGADLAKDARILFSGPIASIYLSDLPESQRQARADLILAKLRSVPYLSAWKSSEIPKSFHYTDTSRIGDVVALLQPGYSFTATRLATTQPAVAGITIANHGYDPAASPAMLGSAIVWRYRHPMGGVDLGRVENTQWYPTVANLLGISPAPGADTRAIHLPN